jgi:ribA/ribD-fused uncharacterized protein
MPITFYTTDFYVFNNFSAHAIEYRGLLYPTAEHAYQAAKCTDPNGKEAIRNARSPILAKQLANETYRAARDPEWDGKKLAVVEEILRAKLAQHPEAQQALRDSGHEDIVEDSPTDYFWGAGADGSGRNMFGKIWMRIREETR